MVFRTRIGGLRLGMSGGGSLNNYHFASTGLIRGFIDFYNRAVLQFA